MAKKPFFCLALVLGLLLAANPVLPSQKTAFGPKGHGVGWLRIHASIQSFKAEQGGKGLIEITSVSPKSRLHSGFVLLNGQFISLHPILNAKASVMQASVQLRKWNYLFVFLYGERGAGIKIKVKVKEKEADQPPVANSQSVATDEDNPASITLTGMSSAGGALTFEILSPPAHGTLGGEPPALTYNPAADYNGPDSFTFKVNDGIKDSAPATVNITVNPVNDPPVAVAAAPSRGYVGETVTLDGTGSTDVDGDTLTYQWFLVSYPGDIKPTLADAVGQTGSFVPLVPGQYEIRLVVSDGMANSLPDEVYISVSYREQKLTASDGTGGDLFGSSISIDGYRAVIGTGAKGAAYIFERESPWAETHRIAGEPADYFGTAVAVSGNYVLVGAYGKNETTGAAYVFKLENGAWSQGVELVAEGGAAGDFFGSAVAISGEYAVVGAYGADTDKDWVKIFARNDYLDLESGMTWNPALAAWENASGRMVLQPAGWATGFHPSAIRITHTSPGPLSLLRILGVNNTTLVRSSSYMSGQELDISKSEDIRLIYAYYPPAITNIEFLVQSATGAPDAGAVYTFERDEEGNYIPQAKLKAGDGEAGDAFGISVAASEDAIVVGADMDDDQGQDSGSAYVFVRNGSDWYEEAKLLASDGQAGDQFGASVAVSGDIVVVGAPGGDGAYVFWYNGENWLQEAKLFDEDGKTGDLFGASVSISGDCIVVGTPKANGSGALFVFKFDGSNWNLEGKVSASDGIGGQDFGASVAISGDTIFAGAMGDDEKGLEAGAAYVYTIDNFNQSGD